MTPYGQDFLRGIQAGSTRSAEIIVPLIIELVRPRSIVDVGCGTGTWLKAFQIHGIGDILGVDGAWVQPEMLVIPKESFRSHDLTQTLKLGRKFDLAISLEVAEHLPGEHAGTFVSTLVGLSQVILFSAAIPFQSGNNHVNEQWPDYWAKLFGEHGYMPIDCIRAAIWTNSEVEFWYAQNTLIFADKRFIPSNPALQEAFQKTRPAQFALVHPRMFLHVADPANSLTLRKLLREIPRLMLAAVKRRLKR